MTVCRRTYPPLPRAVRDVPGDFPWRNAGRHGREMRASFCRRRPRGGGGPVSLVLPTKSNVAGFPPSRERREKEVRFAPERHLANRHLSLLLDPLEHRAQERPVFVLAGADEGAECEILLVQLENAERFGLLDVAGDE